MNRFCRLSLIVSVLLLTACGQEDPPTVAPTNVTFAAGESLIAIDWDVVPGLTYWLIYKQGPSVSLDDKDIIIFNVTPPYLLSGLTNGTQYAVAVTSSQKGSRVGPFSPVMTETPRLLGPSVPWFVGTSLTMSVDTLRSIAYAGGTYVTTGDAATVFVGKYSYTSDTGVTSWEPPTSLPVTIATNLTSVVFDGSRFVALGDDGAVIKSSSTDNLTWEAATAITTPPTMNALAVGAGVYVAVGNAGAIYTNATDGATASWTPQTSGTTNNLYGVAYAFDRFIAVGDSGTLLSSTDGVSWNAETSNTMATLRHVAYGADNYVAVGDGAVVSSTDATSWSAQASPPTGNFHSIVFGPDQQFIAVGTSGALAYSTTGIDGSWATSNAGSDDLNSIASNQVFIAVGAAGANVSGK